MNTIAYAYETFDIFYSSLSVAVVLFDSNFKPAKANQAFLNLIHAKEETLEDHELFLFSEEELSDGSFFLKAFPEQYDTQIRDTQGNTIPVRLNFKKLTKEAGEYSGGLGFFTDLRNTNVLKAKVKKLTLDNAALRDQLAGQQPDAAIKQRKNLEQNIKEAKDFLENVVEACGDGIIILEKMGRIVRVNDSLAAILGRKKGWFRNRTLYELGPLEGTFESTAGETVVLDQSYNNNFKNLLERFMQLKHGSKIQNWEYYAFNKGGKVVPLEMTATIQKDTEGFITGAVCVFRDITERKKAEKALQDAYQFRNRFFTNITHEFRTPLTLAIGPVEGILRGAFGDISSEIQEQLLLVLRNSRQLLKLVNQLLDFSRLEAGAQHLVYEKKDLKTFIAAILESFSFVAKKKKIKLIFDQAEDIPSATIDPGKVQKILFNIVGNAFKFTPEKGTIKVAVTLDSDCGQDRVKIVVTDTGRGIRHEDLKTIFSRFQQADGNIDGKEPGTGIGLAYTRELVEFMGGTIVAASTYGKGSTFSICLPVGDIQAARQLKETADDLLLEPEIELADVQGETALPSEHVTGARPLVLIVDDNSDVLSFVTGIIRDEYDFITARNGNEGLLKLEKYTPDIIICDVMMPQMDGHEFLRRVRSSPGRGYIPFIFLTARAETEVKLEAFAEGADDYIIKPFNSLELLSRVKSLLRIRDLQQRDAYHQKTITRLTQKLQGKYSFGNIMGNSAPMRAVYQIIETIKDSDAGVLITGETGTGKELVANAIHYNSRRKNGSLVSVNCAAIPRELMERELFGHIKGSFTGAVESRKGYFQEADSGTLFLDEIAEMDQDMQVKLLRVFEQKEVMRVGETVPTKVDVRLIAATNKDLLAEVERGNFREDLYYRIYVVPITLPPLRQRSEDIPLLIEHFLNEFCKKQQKEPPPLTEDDLRLFVNYSWPGNVRELRFMIERFCLLGGNVADLFERQHVSTAADDQNLSFDEMLLSTSPIKEAKAHVEKSLIVHALKLYNNNREKVAEQLNISRSYLYRKLREYSILLRSM